MTTNLPASINTIEEAKAFLTELHKNGESYHPEDDANELIGSSELWTREEGEQLNKLMEDIYNLEGNNGNHANPVFDPCEFLLELDPEYRAMVEADEETVNVCHCNNCGGVFYDDNPSDESIDYPLSEVKDKVSGSLELLEDEGGFFKGCPSCKTDGCLMDNLHDNK